MHNSCTPQSLLLLSVFYSKLFPGHFGLTRNNSKCFFVCPDFSPNRLQKYKKVWKEMPFWSKKLNKIAINQENPILIRTFAVKNIL